MASDTSGVALHEFLRMRAGASVVRLRDLAEPRDAVFTGVFISPAGHLLTAYHALESRLLDLHYSEQFHISFEFDPAWLSRDLLPGPFHVIAYCEKGWRDPIADIAVLKLAYEPPAYLPLSASRGSDSLLGSSVRAYGFSVTQLGAASLGEVEGKYLRALPEQGRFRINDVVRGEGQSGGPVIDLQSRAVLGTVVGFFQKEIRTGDAAVATRDVLHCMGLDVDFAALEDSWRRDAALYVREKHPQFKFMSSERHLPDFAEKYLRGRGKPIEVFNRMVKRECHTVLLYGPPGSGKTSVALEVAHELQTAGVVSSMFWHDFSRDEDRSVQQLVRRLGLYVLEEQGRYEIVESYPVAPTEKDDQLAVSMITECLNRNNQLLVLDNLQFVQREDRLELLAVVYKLLRASVAGNVRVILTSWDLVDHPDLAALVKLDGLTEVEVDNLLDLHCIVEQETRSVIKLYRHDITCVGLLIRRPDWLRTFAERQQLPREPRELHRYWLSKYRTHISLAARRVLLALAVLSDPAEPSVLEEVAEIDDFVGIVDRLQTSPSLVESEELGDGQYLYYLHYNVKRAMLAISDHKEILRTHRLAAEYFSDVGHRPLPAARHWWDAREVQRALDVLYDHHEQIISAGDGEELRRVTETISLEAAEQAHNCYKLNVILASCCNVRGMYGEAEDYWRFALEDSPSDRVTAALHNRRADSFRLSSDYDSAREQYHLAMRIAVDGIGEDFRRQAARASLGLAKLSRLRADYDYALVQYKDAQKSFKAAFDQAGQIEAEFGIGEVTRLMREWDDSEKWYSRSLERARNVGNLERQAYALWGVAEVHRLTGRHAAATELHVEGLELCSRVGDTRSEGWALLGLAEVHRSLAQSEEAVIAYQEAKEKFTRTRSSTEFAHTLLGLAEACRALNKVDLDHYENAEGVYRKKGLRHCLTMSLLAKGSALLQLNQQGMADEAFEEALALAMTCSLKHEIELVAMLRCEGRPAVLMLNFP